MVTDPEKSKEVLEKELKEAREKISRLEEESNQYKNNLENCNRLFENTLLAYHSLDRQGKILEVNRNWLNLFGYTKEEVIGRTFSEFLPDDWEEKFRECFAELKNKGEIREVEYEVRLKDSSSRLFLVNGTVSRDQKGKFLQSHCTLEDITERKKAMNALHESEERFRRLFHQANELIFVHDLSGRFHMASAKACQNLGYTEQELLNMMVADVDTGFIQSGDEKKFWRQDLPVIFESRYRRKDGSFFPVTVSLSSIQFHGRTLILSIAKDITQQRRMEEILRHNELILNTAGDGIFGLDREGRHTFVNPAAAHILGWPAEELIGRPSHQVWHHTKPDGTHYPESECPVYLTLKNGTEHKRTEEYFVRRNGDLFPVQFTSRPIIEDDRIKGAVVTFTDISEQKESEIEHERLMSAIEQTNEVIVITDINGNIRYANPAFEKVTGYTRDEVSGENPRILQSGEHDEEFYRDLWDTITNGGTWRGSFMNRKKDGTLYTEDAVISPVFEKSGRIADFVAVKRDITEELELQKQLNHAQRLEAIGNLAGGIAHDFNNILFPIIGLSELMGKEFSPGSPEHKNLHEIIKAGKRGRDLVRQILAVGRQSEYRLIPVQIQMVLKEVIKLIRSTVPANIEISINVQQNCSAVMADPTQIHQLAMNLITNAYHALNGEDGQISIRLEEIELAGKKPGGLTLEPGKYALLTVSDTGPGIDPDIIDTIFEPYVTTKEHGKGTGLGLSVVYGIVGKYGGELRVENEVGRGAAFYVYLPVADKKVDKQEKEDAKILPEGKEKILLVDDEQSILKLQKQMLEKFGYQVETRSSSLEALELFKARPDNFDLIVTDMTMPNMRGDELAKEIRARDKKTPVIICTGFSEKIDENTAERIGINGFLMKPILMKDMMQTVRKVLDETKQS